MLRQIMVFAFISLFVCGAAQAVDDGDSGIYLIVNVKGELSNKSFRLSHTDAEWVIEDRKPDGSWASVTCEKDCKMLTSAQTDIQRFFPASTLLQITPDCIHSKAFAFCGYSLKSDAKFRGYLFVALTEAQPITLRLARVIPDKK